MGNDLNGTALTALAAALAPYLVSELAKVQGGAGGNPTTQQGGGAGAQQNTGATFAGQAGTTATGFAAPAQAQQTAANPFGAPQQEAAPTVTADMIQTLITPLVQNEQIKQVLMQQMQQMGIQNLPDAQPAQLPELYQRFKAVEKQAQDAGLIGGAGTPAPTPSLI